MANAPNYPTVGNWEKGTVPNSDHLPKLSEQLKSTSEDLGDGVTYQLLLPFDQPLDLMLKLSAQTADTIHFQVQVRRRTS
jgi:hypothetical protein